MSGKLERLQELARRKAFVSFQLSNPIARQVKQVPIIKLAEVKRTKQGNFVVIGHRQEDGVRRSYRIDRIRFGSIDEMPA